MPTDDLEPSDPMEVPADRSSLMTLEQFVLDRQQRFSHSTGSFSRLLRDLSVAAKIISRNIRRAGILDVLGETGTVNVQDEKQKKLDRIAHRELVRALRKGGECCMIGSEEQPDAIPVNPNAETQERYAVFFDPLDGSSNLESNNPMGTVVAVYDSPLPASGRSLVAAGFVLYGPVTTMVAGVGAPGNAPIHEYLVTEAGDREKLERIRLPDDPTVYGFGGRVPDWPADFTTYVDEVEDELKLRYGGAMIADVSQVLSYGGVFAYPALESAPDGKLRLQFEGNPVAYLVEGAGGGSSDGARSLLDVEPTAIHQRVPVHVGNADLVDRLELALDDVRPR